MAKFADNPHEYKIFYRDLDRILEKTLPEFVIESGDFQTIPASRIERIEKNDNILFEKRKQEDD